MSLLRFALLAMFVSYGFITNAQDNVKKALDISNRAEELYERGDYGAALKAVDKSILLLKNEGMSPPSKLLDLRARIEKKYVPSPKKIEPSALTKSQNRSYLPKVEILDSAHFVVENYLEAIGGADQWRKLKGLKWHSLTNQNGMTLSLTSIRLNDGRYRIKSTSSSADYNFSYLAAFDGEQEWTKMSTDNQVNYTDDKELEEKKALAKEGLCPYVDYVEKGISLNYKGKETINGISCYKIEVVRTRLLSTGGIEEKKTNTWFKTSSFLLYAEEFILNDGNKMITTYTDYNFTGSVNVPTTYSNSISDQVIEYKYKVDLVDRVDNDIFNP